MGTGCIGLPYSVVFSNIDVRRILWIRPLPGPEVSADMLKARTAGRSRRRMTMVKLELLLTAEHPMKLSLASLGRHSA